MLRAAIFLCVGALLTSIATADVFKFVDEKGNVMYTDRPQKLPAQRLDIQSQRTDTVEVEQRTEAEMKEMESRAKARQQTNQTASTQRQAAETNAASKAEACAKAREDYRVRTANWRLYEEQPDGERRYLSAAEIDAARDSAKQAMDQLCAGL
jgi:hypothetical protein